MGYRIVSGGCHLAERKNSDFTALRYKSLSRTCTTTPCSTVGWPPVMWKGGGAHVPLSV
ncbi:unnamed protein product [Spirodela intermedia]|uniref:Uncharacterized protein n=1 Tax=Spirodela intermedia TaxID=51605 RepID=A0A7I8LNS5_SPIIN|nr:unnamed protein product [Spirodela intermedia]